MAMPVYAWEPRPVVDHPHERLHQHDTFLGVLGRKAPDQIAHPNRPDVDVSDLGEHCYIDVEAPGVKNPEQISIKWYGWRTLVVSGNVYRPLDGELSPAQPSTSEAVKAPDTTPDNGAEPASDAPASTDKTAVQDTVDLPSYLIYAERRVGFFKREFYFPFDMEMEKLKAELDAGLLRITLPKKHAGSIKHSGEVAAQRA